MSRAPRQTSPDDSKPSIDSVGDGPSFEKALAELEKLVERMEGGDLSLEQSLAAHKRGLELARHCQTRLEAAQQQVRVLEGDVLKSLTVAQNPAPADSSADSSDSRARDD